MLIIISNAIAVKNEAQFINDLFYAGLEIFHLRKPEAKEQDIFSLLNNIETKYHAQVSLHQHHHMAEKYGINRLHFTEAKRKQTSSKILSDLKEKGNILSTSIHHISEYAGLSTCFGYTFFGPVFNSISKQGYSSTLSINFEIPLIQNHPLAIAIGGITAANLPDALNMNFAGVAALGTIWQQPEQSIEQFKTLQHAWKLTGR